MKKSLILFLALALTACNKNEKNSKGLELSGVIDGLKSGSIVIKRVDADKLVTVDSMAVNGDPHFNFNIALKSPEMLYMVLDRGVTSNIDDNLMFFAEPGKMTINTDLDHFYANAKISGSVNNDLYQEFKNVRSRYTEQQLELSVAKLNALREKKPFDETQNEEKIKTVVKSRYLYAINFAFNHRDKAVAPYIALTEIGDANLKYLDTIRNALTPEVSGSRYGKMLESLINERRKEENKTDAK